MQAACDAVCTVKLPSSVINRTTEHGMYQCRSASGDAEDDDWEQTADRTPRGPTAPQASAQASTSGRKAYTLDWMLHQQDQPECQQLPKDFDAGDLVAIGWRSDPRMVSSPELFASTCV